MKKRISMLLCSTMLLSGCSTSGSPVAEKQPGPFDGWSSNTVVATGSNYIYDKADNKIFRTYFPVEEAGELEYCFYFSDTVDSTWERGRYSFAGKPGGDYTINSAVVYTVASPEEPLTEGQNVTFDGTVQKAVHSGETFWSDPVVINVPEDGYLVWEWTLTGTDIPCIRMSELTPSFVLDVPEDTPEYNMDVPAPQFIAAKRQVKRTIACFGDSITQGAQTSAYTYQFWVSQLSDMLGSDYSVWNCGLGYARASDAALGGDWLVRAKSADVVILAFGTNDLAVGQYGQMGASSADDIEKWLRTIIDELQSAGCQVILCNAPPFDFDESTESIRTELNARIPAMAEETNCAFFDWNALLADPENPGHSLYGGHPDDAGCQIIAESLLAQYGDILR